MVKRIALALLVAMVLGGGLAVAQFSTPPRATFTVITFNAFVFANIGVIGTNGQIGYCSDCTIANPCASGGTGAIAKRLNGVNVCN
jgi:hypothetical protein